MGKSNIRSFRYSDEVAKIIEGFEGSSMNGKFENLVLFCSRAVPDKRKQLEQMDRQLELKRSELRKLQERVVCVQSIVRSLESIKYQVDRLVVTQFVLSFLGSDLEFVLRYQHFASLFE